jgi:hypothetical protein
VEETVIGRGLIFAAALLSAQAAHAQAYEGQIDGEYKGWEGDTIYKLMDGHIIQQASYHYHYHYAYSPKIIIYRGRDGTLKMHIEGDDDQDVSIAILK